MNCKQLTFLAALAVPLLSTADLPTGETLMNRHVEVSGGKEAWNALKSQVVSAKLEVAGQGVSGKFTSWSSVGNGRTLI